VSRRSGTAPDGTVVPGFLHEAFIYRGDVEFLDGVLPFVREGLAGGETVVVAEPQHQLGLLRDALGADAAAVRLLDMADVGANPGRVIAMWAAALAEARSAGRQLRGVGEPAFAGRRPQELDECYLHELLLNRAFDGAPWRLLCPYDSRHLPVPVTDRALLSHPEWSALATRGRTGSDIDAALADMFGTPLSAPASPVLRGDFTGADVRAVRHTVVSWSRRCRLPEDQVEVLELAAAELTANSVRHGGGGGSVALWEDAGAAVVQFTDSGHVADPLAGRLPPGSDDDGCSGLYLLQQLCDLVQVRSSRHGTTVRVSTWR
jgi:anti-sigma regulatory factor (Ser/Thr protein kinase)